LFDIYIRFLILRQQIILLRKEGETLTKDELINAVIKTCKDDNLTKRLAGDIVDAAFENISKAIKKEKRFAYPSFGTFTVRSRKARKGRNPQTGEEIKIKASKTVGFKPAPTLKTSL
jgi:DNA-binding protein HU-beta